MYQRDVHGSTAWRKSDGRRGTSVEPHFGALKDESVAGFSRGKVRMPASSRAKKSFCTR